jgi:hypothetical protein
MQKRFAMAAMLAASFGAHAADNSELAAIRAQIDDMKRAYEQRIAALEQKLSQAEAKSAGARSLRRRRRAPSCRRQQRERLQSRGVADPAGAIQEHEGCGRARYYRFLAGRWPRSWRGGCRGINKRGFSLNHTELVLAANIDPYWRGQAIIATLDGTAEVEEAWFQSLGLGHGIGLKGGRFRSGIGYLNEQHPHMWDFADAPLMYQAMFGTHGSYAQDGVQFKWLAPTETFVEFGAEIGRGANFPGTDRNKNGSGAAAVFAHVGGEVGVSNSWRAGVSYLTTRAKSRTAHFAGTVDDEVEGLFDGRSQSYIADFVWKWAPNGNPKYQNFKLQTEYFQRREKGDLTCATPDDAGAAVACDGLLSAYRTRQSGWYAQGVYQFTPHWRAGLRYEQLDSGVRDFGDNAAYLVVDSYRPKKASAMIDYSWSEFSRVRLQYAQDKSMLGITDNQVTVQYIMSLGAHGAHKF